MTDKVTKFINSLSTKTKSQLKAKLTLLRKDPFNMPGVKKLEGSDAYRLRMGKIRIIYVIIKSEVIIIDIDYRGNIY